MKNEKVSSPYLIACDEKDREKQKELLYSVFGPVIFGRRAARDKEELKELFRKIYGIDVEHDFVEGDEHYEEYREALDALKDGLFVSSGDISFDDEILADLAWEVWNVYEELNRNGFRRINTMLEE